ncbi:MAG: FRG domain-containing protein, partial [Candidatus Sulfotelmatobacter sp.]
ASSESKLIPSLYRSESGREPYGDTEVREQFRRRALPLVAERPPRDDWEWYSLMQHYGAPTRLLDWTDSALVALYFAIASYATGSAPTPAVWALNPWKLNRKVGLNFEGPVSSDWRETKRYLRKAYGSMRLPKYPIALDPVFIAQRMLVQHSHFTLHGSDVRGLDEMIKELKLQDALFKLVILSDDESVKILRQRVALLGISETTIFPDLAGLGKELRIEYDLSSSNRSRNRARW